MLYNHKGQVIRRDGYYNEQTGYGGPDDPMVNTNFLPSAPIPYSELEAQYESNWIANRGINIPVDDRLGKGIEFITNNDDSEARRSEIKSITGDCRKIKLLNHLIDGKYWGRLYGGGLLYFDYGDDQEFNFQDRQSRINFELRDSQRGVPNKIWVVDRWFATPGSYYTDAIHGSDHPKRGEVETYVVTLHTTGWSRVVYAHESRCIKIDGLPFPPRLKARNHMWGNSVLQLVNDIVKFFGVSLKAMADTFEDFNWKTLQIENLAQLITDNNPENFEAIVAMTAMAAKNYHNQNIGIAGVGAELKKHATTVTGLKDMAEFMSNMVAAAFPPGIPDSIFFAAKGGALAGTAAENDIRNYYKALKSLQENTDRPHIEQAIFLLGYEPENFPFTFPELGEPTQLEKIEARDKQADVDVKYINSGVLLPEEVAVSRFSKAEPELNQTIVDFDTRKKMMVDEEEGEDSQENNTEDGEEQREDAAFDVEEIFTVISEEEDV